MKSLIREMAEVPKYGQMALSTKDTGRMTKPMAKEDLSMPMEMYMKVNGRMTRLMVMVSTCILTVLNMRDTGRRTNNTEKVGRPGLMGHSTKETM